MFEQTRGYDAVGNASLEGSILPTETDAQAFCYDEQNRLTFATSQSGSVQCSVSFIGGTLGGSAQYTATYTYDTLDRLTSSPVGSYTYGDPNHLHAVTAIGSSPANFSASYDAAGNILCRAPTSSTTYSGTPTCVQLTYDNEGRLSAWQNTPSNLTSMTSNLYDGEGP
jgi:YD repeat-containing protein